jgi:hypothetical protein
MSFGNRTYIPGPSKPAGQPILIPGSAYDRKLPFSTPTLIVITLIIVVAIIIFTLNRISKVNPPAIQLPVDTDVLDLSKLVNLSTEGQCCIPPLQLNANPRWIYSPANNFTYSTDKSAPDIVCQGLTASNLTSCLNYVSDAEGNPKILAHRGITLYYPFTNGQAGSGICGSYTTC